MDRRRRRRRPDVELTADTDEPVAALCRTVAAAFLGVASPSAVIDAAARAEAGRSPRLACLGQQLAIEALAISGELERARRLLAGAAAGVLIDLFWLDRCPALASLRDGREWSSIRRPVLARARAIWA